MGVSETLWGLFGVKPEEVKEAAEKAVTAYEPTKLTPYATVRIAELEAQGLVENVATTGGTITEEGKKWIEEHPTSEPEHIYHSDELVYYRTRDEIPEDKMRDIWYVLLGLTVPPGKEGETNKSIASLDLPLIGKLNIWWVIAGAVILVTIIVVAITWRK